MNREMWEEIVRIGGDPLDILWEWFLFRGPHGSYFTWGQKRHNPPGYVGLEHLKSVVAELEQRDPGFSIHVRNIATAAITSIDSDIVRIGIQIIAVVGEPADVKAINDLRATRGPLSCR